MPKIKALIILLVLIPVSFFLFQGTAVPQSLDVPSSKIPREPGWKDPSYRGWEIISINGLIATYYDLKHSGALDYMVIRRILRKTSSEDMSVDEAIESAKRDNIAVYISTPIIYFASKYPLFYCLGVDFNRNCKDIWIDVQEDGLNGNEVKYTLSEPKIPVR